MHSVPPELLTEDGIEERAAELRHRIAREWVRYAVTEGLLIGVPFFAVLTVLIATDASETRILALAGVAMGVWVAFSLYWVFVRIQPLRRELESLERATER